MAEDVDDVDVLTTPQPRYEHVDIRGVVGRTSRSLPLKTNIVNTDAARCARRGASRHAAPRSCATYCESGYSIPPRDGFTHF